VNAGQAANDDIVANNAVTGNGHLIGKDDPAAKRCIMAHMCPGHQQTIITHPCDTAAALRAGVQGGPFADTAPCADNQPRAFAHEFQILRNLPNRGEGENHRAGTDFGPASDNRMAFHNHTLGKGDVRADQRKRPHFSPRPDNCARFDMGAGMNAGIVRDCHPVTPLADQTWR